MTFYRCIEYFMLYILDLSYMPLIHVKKNNFGQSSFMGYLNKIFNAVKNNEAMGLFSGHLSSYLPLIYLINSFFPVDFTKYFKYLKR